VPGSVLDRPAGHAPGVPEILEIELYRRAAETVVGRTITTVDAPDSWYLKGGLTQGTLRRVLRRRTVTAVRRRGKLLLLDTDGPVLGLRFGMTGRLQVDGSAAIERLEYGSSRIVPGWERIRLGFDGGGKLVIHDPRRLGGVTLDPPEDVLGPDALAITPAALRAAVAPSRGPLKAALLDQHRVAGLGNLLVDETLWRAGLDPARPANTLSDAEWKGLHRSLRSTLSQLLRRGGSHTGDLMVARVRGGVCPRDGTPLARRTIGGRTTYSCPTHQR
jgi:formamidopyrimidine-DNA glycosylase